MNPSRTPPWVNSDLGLYRKCSHLAQFTEYCIDEIRIVRSVWMSGVVLNVLCLVYCSSSLFGEVIYEWLARDNRRRAACMFCFQLRYLIQHITGNMF